MKNVLLVADQKVNSYQQEQEREKRITHKEFYTNRPSSFRAFHVVMQAACWSLHASPLWGLPIQFSCSALSNSSASWLQFKWSFPYLFSLGLLNSFHLVPIESFGSGSRLSNHLTAATTQLRTYLPTSSAHGSAVVASTRGHGTLGLALWVWQTFEGTSKSSFADVSLMWNPHNSGTTLMANLSL